MGAETGISWTDHTFNIAWGCQKVSPGCTHCYAEDLSTRYGHGVWGPNKPRRTFGAKHWAEPIAWNRAAERAKRRAKVFCSSMCDIFEDHPTIERELRKLWPLIRASPGLDWQLLTKRAERIAECLPADWGEGYPNVWLGVSIENREHEWRVQLLRRVPARVRFLSYEPALGPIDGIELTGISWLIYGGESGAAFRPDQMEWATNVANQCYRGGVLFFYKQCAARYPGTRLRADMGMPREFPLSVIGEPVLSKGQG